MLYIHSFQENETFIVTDYINYCIKFVPLLACAPLTRLGTEYQIQLKLHLIVFFVWFFQKKSFKNT